MKKAIALIISLVLLLSCAAAGAGFAEEDKLNVVVTIFPIYDWVREIVGADMDHVNLTLLLDSGVDLHSYQPTARDIMAISTADLFVYVGGESDEWVEDVLASAMNPGLVAVSLVDAMGEDIKDEEIVEGMEHEHEHEHDHDHDHDEDEDEDEDHDHDRGHEHEEEEEADEHVWLSLRCAQKLTASIAEAIEGIDPDHAAHYQENAAAYIAKLADLDARYTETVNAAAFKTLLFGDRFPFRYLADDYGLDYFAAFTGCSAESEASFSTVMFLAQKVDELDLPAVLTLEHPTTRIAQTVAENTAAKNRKILALDSMQGTTAADIAAGMTYLSVMESNLGVLAEALN
ncbi:MAG: metal ABC transporter substrate-binding protein [Clostridiales bacterium]|nr:metal ABC transporter substrate-binding protein [Clostridiales bacterium]